MNRKPVILVFLIFLNCYVYAQTPKWYQDSKNQYQGYANATYYGNDDSYDLYTVHKGVLEVASKTLIYSSAYQKLSREDTFLLWSALNEWDYKIGDIYNVLIMYPNGLYILLTVKITKKDSATFYGSTLRMRQN